MKKENIFDVIAISVTIVLALVGIICYFCRFSINMFDSQESFAEFGDYVGGVIGTIVSFLSLVYIPQFRKHFKVLGRVSDFVA